MAIAGDVHHIAGVKVVGGVSPDQPIVQAPSSKSNGSTRPTRSSAEVTPPVASLSQLTPKAVSRANRIA